MTGSFRTGYRHGFNPTDFGMHRAQVEVLGLDYAEYSEAFRKGRVDLSIHLGQVARGSDRWNPYAPGERHDLYEHRVFIYDTLVTLPK